MRTENDYGSRTTPVDNRACGYTRNGNNLKVWRAQLYIRTANVSGAGTDDDVKVQLNSPLPTNAPSGNSTWLDYGPRLEPLYPWFPLDPTKIWRDDFDRGREFTYDLNLSHISELSDITMLTIAKDGTDTLGIAEISLKVNGKEVFKRLFGETASACLWINEGGGYSPSYTIWHSELRTHPSWQAYIASPPEPPDQISNEEIVSRLESMIGHAIHGTDAYWDKEHIYGPLRACVEATRLDNETLQVDLDLAASGVTDDMEVDLNFRLHFKIDCDTQAGTATLRITTTNVSSFVDLGMWDEVIVSALGFGAFIPFIEYEIAKEIENAFQPITQTIVLNTGGLCPSVVVRGNGDIEFRPS